MSARSCAFVVVIFSFAPRLSFAQPTPDSPAPVAPDSAAATVAPRLLERAEPVYPEPARIAGVGAVVGLQLDVAVDGQVSDVRVVRRAGFGFDEAAVAAARRYRFSPALVDGQPAASTVELEQRFAVHPRLTAEAVAAAPPAAAVAATPPAAATPPLAAEVVAKERAYQSKVVAKAPALSASAMTIANDDFDLRPHTSPNDVLRVVPGLLATQHQGGGKADQLFLRGFDADHGSDVGVYVDGVPINLPSHAHGQGFADLHWLITETIDHIEVEKGDYDARYGDFSTAGTLNIVTREQVDQSSVQYTVGGFPTLSGKVVEQGRFVGILAPKLPDWASKLHPWLAFEVAYDNGEFTAPEHLTRYNLFGKLGYDVSDHFKIGLFVEAYSSGWNGSGQIPAHDVGRIGQYGSEDPSEGGQTERQMLTLFAHYHDGDSRFDATAYVTRYRLALFNDFTFFLNDPVNGDEIEQDDARVYAGARLAYQLRKRWRGIVFRTSAGIDMRYDGAHVDRWHDTSQNGDWRQRIGRLQDSAGIGIDASDDDMDILNVAGFIEEDVTINRWLRVMGGFRFDGFGFVVSDQSQVLAANVPNSSGQRQFGVPSPKASVVFTPIRDFDHGLELFLNFGEGFHSNMAPVALMDGKTITNSDGSTFVLHAIPRYYAGEIGARVSLWNRLDVNAIVWASYIQNETQFDADIASFVPSAAGAPPRLRLRSAGALDELARRRLRSGAGGGDVGAVERARRRDRAGAQALYDRRLDRSLASCTRRIALSLSGRASRIR